MAILTADEIADFCDNEDSIKFRLFSFCNTYLSSLQKGLQQSHAIADMSTLCLMPLVEGEDDDELDDLATFKTLSYISWASRHKTIIMYDYGNSSSLNLLYSDVLVQSDYLSAIFHEDEESLRGAATVVSIVLPNYIYETASKLRNGYGVLESDDESSYFVLDEPGKAVKSVTAYGAGTVIDLSYKKEPIFPNKKILLTENDLAIIKILMSSRLAI